MRTARFVLAALLILAPAAARGAVPAADPAFGKAGTVVRTYSELGGSVSSIALQPDGKPVLAGRYRIKTTNRNGIGTQAFISRARSDGSADETLAGGVIQRNGLTKVLVSADGRIIAGGTPLLARYQPDGTLDEAHAAAVAAATKSFADGFAFRDFALQADGKVVVVGTLSPIGSTRSGGPALGVVRFNGDGSLDAAFGTDGHVRLPVAAGHENAASAVALPQGKIALALNNLVDGVRMATVVRLNADGTPDRSFGTAGRVGKPDEMTRSLVAQPDGKLLLLTVPSPTGARSWRMTRFTDRGEPDASFGSGGVVIQPIADDVGAYPLAVDSDGNILVATTRPPRVSRFRADGKPDPRFGEAGALAAASLRAVDAMAIGPDGALWIAGESAEPSASTAPGRRGNPAVVRYTGGASPRTAARP
ncbi:MAG: delta-60 repeat domain-containing protein [Casimicrobiaceae bacterium]